MIPILGWMRDDAIDKKNVNRPASPPKNAPVIPVEFADPVDVFPEEFKEDMDSDEGCTTSDVSMRGV